MTRNILDKDGNVIGELTLPDETSEEIWEQKLGMYSYVKPTSTPTITEVINDKVEKSIVFGNELIVEAATGNVMAGITQAGKTREVSDYLAKLERYLRAGSLYAAIDEIDDLLAAETPEEIAEFVTDERLEAVKVKLQIFISKL